MAAASSRPASIGLGCILPCLCGRRVTNTSHNTLHTVYPKKYAHGFVVLCFVMVMQSFIMNSHELFIHIHQGCFAGTGAIVRLPQCQWSKPDGYGKISQCITTTKHSKAKTVCIFLGIYCIFLQAPCVVTWWYVMMSYKNLWNLGQFPLHFEHYFYLDGIILRRMETVFTNTIHSNLLSW